MMCGLLFSSFLIAEWLNRFKPAWIAAALVAYFLISGGITYRNLYHDTGPLLIEAEPEALEKMFP
jgi:hypothetical protein